MDGGIICGMLCAADGGESDLLAPVAGYGGAGEAATAKPRVPIGAVPASVGTEETRYKADMPGTLRLRAFPDVPA